MSTLIRSIVVILGMSAGILLGQEKIMKVTASSKLQLAIVDTARTTPARQALHAAFSAGLAKAMSVACGDPVQVQTKRLSADQAAFGLDNGTCQVVLTLGKSLPRPLVKSGMERLHATLGAEKNERNAYLVFNNGDEGLKKLLTQSFASAISDAQFLDALDGGIEADGDLPTGKTLASATP